MKQRNGKYTIIIVLLSVVALLLAGVIGVSAVRHRQTPPDEKSKTGEYALVTDTAYDNSYQEIEIASDCGNVFVLTGADNQLHLKIWADEENVRIMENGSRLDITANARELGKHSFRKKNMQQVRIELYLPSGFDRSLMLKTDYGSFEVESFPLMKLKTESEYGSLTLDEVASLEAVCEYGSVKAAKIHTFVKAESAMGNIDIDELPITEDSALECEMGNVHIGSAPTARVKADTNIGAVNVRPDPVEATVNLTIENNNGSITVE